MASIRERNGKFNVIYSYTNEKGERKQKWETYETKAEAKRRKKEIEYKKEMGSFVVRKCKTLDELITEYVALYGKENWALSTYEGNVSLINNYILPIIGDTKLSEINTRFIERYYQSLLKRRAVINPLNKTSRNEFVSSSTVRDINKLLRNCFEQAVKWELMEKNPCTHATVPKHALLIGILIAFTALVPIFGAFIGCAVGSFLIFMVNPKQAVLFIIVFLLLQQIEGNLIYPHVVGGSVGLPSIWVLAAVTIGGNLMGIIGMLIFIPLVSVFYTIFREFVYLRLKKQHIKRVTRTDVEEYAEEEIASSFIVPNEK